MPPSGLIRVAPITTIDQIITTPVVRWPNASSIYFELDDAQFQSAADKVRVEMMVSWDNGLTFPYVDTNEWSGADKSRNGGPPHVTLGPFMKVMDPLTQALVENRPTHLKFRVSPLAGTPHIGLMADVL
jgi:hypothetical protein